MNNLMLRPIAAAVVFSLSPLAAAGDSPDWQVDDFAVTYGAKVGIARGQTRLEMRHVVGNEYVIESWTELRGLVSLFKRGNIYERAQFDYVDGQILTRSFERRDTISGEDRNVRVDYDWDAGESIVTYQDTTARYPIEAGVSNTLVMQVELMQALSTGARPEWLDVVGHKGRLRFDVVYEGPESIKVDNDEQTLFRYWHSRRESGIRTTFWASPERHHLPLKARIEKNDKLRGQLTLIGDVASSASRAAR